jgi:two-component system LytT family response regulator
MYRALIVDDEPLARQRVRDLLSPHEDFVVLGECASGEAAILAIARDAPDVIFLDVQMPDFDGFQVAASVLETFDETSALPLVVFVTAHDRFALRAFETAAVDYLLKPVGQSRLDESVKRIRRLMGTRQRGTASAASSATRDAVRALGDLGATPFIAQRFAVRHRDGIVFIAARDIDWIDAAGNYMRLHVGRATYLIRSTMSAFERRLDPDQFVRIHRSAVVNVERVARAQRSDHGDFIIQLVDGVRLTTSRSYSRRLRDAIRSAGGRR